MRKIPARRDIRWRPKFLTRYLETGGDIGKACEAVGITKVDAYHARLDDPDFKQDWDDVKLVLDEARADAIEFATANRAVDGTPYRKYSPKSGELIEEGTTPDTPAAALMLKAIRPERFVEKNTAAPEVGIIQSVADLVRALGEERRGRALLPQPGPVTPLTAPAIEAAVVPEGAARLTLVKASE